MPLTAQQHQGLHGEGFVFAMASAAGLLASRPTIDVDGIDWLIAHPGPLGQLRSPKIEIQVKTWVLPRARLVKPTARKRPSASMAAASPVVRSDGAWSYRMAVPHFNQLAGPGFAIRRYLVLVIVPESPGQYALCGFEDMRLGHAAYWVSLADESPMSVGPGEPKTLTVSVPRGNLLTPQTLLALVRGDKEDRA
ncbi:MAG TPA: DUF4365 domain-containing protein [Micromonospora sp.]|nr:DUF4365 domain-containing protein [Micromonospora sp.]